MVTRTTLNFKDAYITFESSETYHSTFIKTNVAKEDIEELLPMIRTTKDGDYYLPFVVDKISRNLPTIIPGVVVNADMVKPRRIDFNVCLTGHTTHNKVIYYCEPITIDNI